MILAAIAAASVAACDLPRGWAAVEARRTRYIIFGESHGTEQAPAFVARVACALATRHERLLVAIEQESTDDAAFQQVWASPDRSFAEALRRAPGWKGRDDGVASQAMFAMLVRLHRLRAAGAAIDMVRFNGVKDDAQRARYAKLPGQGPHDAAQAENIRTAAAAKPYDHVLVLTGGAHARKDSIVDHGPTFLPMAMRLAPAAAITSLRFYSGAGTLWGCLLRPDAKRKPGDPVSADQIDCANHPSRSEAPLSGPPFVALGTPSGATPEGRFDGYVWLGPITGSAPAVP